uniref:Uncharacterized protein n=1 Tax=Panagrolaimus davidi TaxID=227884 RepID=A0A914QFA5_9BILA
MNTENSTDESPEDIALLSDDIAAEGNPFCNNQPEDVEEIHPIENSTDENATADPSHSTSRQANIIHENEITVTMQASPGSTSNQSKIIRAPNYRIGPEYYGNRWVKHLYIFDSDDKSMCYNYTLKKGNYFYCTKCKTSNKIIISATIISNENGEECVKLGENGHVCQKQKYQPHIIIYEPNYKLNTS